MITQGDSGLTAPQYASLLAAMSDPSFLVTLEQYSLSFSSHDSSGHSGVIENFDAVVSSTVIVRAWTDTADQITYQTLATEDSGDQSWAASGNLVATGIDLTVPISIVASGATVRIFYYDGTGENIEYFESADSGASWGATQVVLNVSDVIFLAATSTTACHYVTLTSENNRRFHIVEYSGSWSATNSGLYWPWDIDSLDAITAGQEDDGAAASNDVIIFASDLPHIFGLKVDGTEVNHTITEVQGIVTVRYQNGRWSDHFEFDVTDNAPSYPARHDVRVSKSGNFLFLNYHREDGGDDYPHSTIALSRSKSGIEWEIPYLLEEVIAEPSILLKRGNHAYLINSQYCYRSLSQGYTGDAQTTQDITNRLMILGCAMGDIQALNMTLANPQQVLDSLSPFSDDVSLQARVKLGYTVDGTELRVQTLLADIDTIGGSLQVPADHEIIQGRDIGARLLTFRPDHVIEKDNHKAGGDNFESADTDYGGLVHTAVQDGSWQTPEDDSLLVLLSNQAPGLAFSTFVNAWNGDIQAAFKVGATDTDDWAGLVGRALDKDNFLVVKYDADADTLKLFDRRDNRDVGLGESSSMSWGSGTWYWLKLRVRYGYVWVYSSTDGVTWTEKIAQELPGMVSTTALTWANFVLEEIPLSIGRFGYAGHGYSDETDEWPDPPPPMPYIPDISVEDDDDPGADQWIFGTEDDGVFYTNNLEDANPDYHDMNDGLDAVGAKRTRDLKIMEWVDGHRTLFSANRCGVYEYTNLPPPGGHWIKRQAIDVLISLAGAENYQYQMCYFIRFSIEHEGWAALFYRSTGEAGVGGQTSYAMVAITHDGFKTLEGCVVVESTLGVSLNYAKGEVAYAQHSDGKVLYCTFGRYGTAFHDCRLYKSTDGGVTWTYLTQETSVGNTKSATVWVPYVSKNHDDSIVWWYTGAHLWRSTDSGATWTSIFAESGSLYGHCAGPTYSGQLMTLANNGEYWEYSDTIGKVQFGPVFPGDECDGSFVMDRGVDLRVDKVLYAGKENAAAAFIYTNDGTNATSRQGDWDAVTGRAFIKCIARHEYSSLEVEP